MPAVTIRNLPEATHRALKARAAKHGRSTEAEIRDIIVIKTSGPVERGIGPGLRRFQYRHTLPCSRARRKTDRESQ